MKRSPRYTALKDMAEEWKATGTEGEHEMESLRHREPIKLNRELGITGLNYKGNNWKK